MPRNGPHGANDRPAVPPPNWQRSAAELDFSALNWDRCKFMNAEIWKIGDRCYTQLAGDSKLEPATVVHIFTVPSRYSVPFYVVELARRDWRTLEVRDATLLTRDPRVPPPITEVQKCPSRTTFS